MNDSSLQFRPLVIDDADTLLAWKNDSETRKWSGNTAEVRREDHIKWLQSVIANPGDKILRIAEMGGVPVGLVRTATHSNGGIECHYTVAPRFRSRGIGTAMVHLFVAEFIPEADLVLIIKQGNIPSEQIAKSFHLIIRDIVPSTDPSDPTPMIHWRKP